MYIALGLMFVGILLGVLTRKRLKIKLSGAIMVVICLLLFVLGLELGNNKELLSSFATIGVSAITISLLAVTGSCITGWLFYKFIYNKR